MLLYEFREYSCSRATLSRAFFALLLSLSFLLNRFCALANFFWYLINAFKGFTFSPSEVTKKSVKPKSIPTVLSTLANDLISSSEQKDTKYLSAQSLAIFMLEYLPSNGRNHLILGAQLT